MLYMFRAKQPNCGTLVEPPFRANLLLGESPSRGLLYGTLLSRAYSCIGAPATIAARAMVIKRSLCYVQGKNKYIIR